LNLFHPNSRVNKKIFFEWCIGGVLASGSSGQLKLCNQGLYLKEKLHPSDKVFLKVGTKKMSPDFTILKKISRFLDQAPVAEQSCLYLQISASWGDPKKKVSALIQRLFIWKKIGPNRRF
jgi:hypothetical protein